MMIFNNLYLNILLLIFSPVLCILLKNNEYPRKYPIYKLKHVNRNMEDVKNLKPQSQSFDKLRIEDPISLSDGPLLINSDGPVSNVKAEIHSKLIVKESIKDRFTLGVMETVTNEILRGIMENMYSCSHMIAPMGLKLFLYDISTCIWSSLAPYFVLNKKKRAQIDITNVDNEDKHATIYHSVKKPILITISLTVPHNSTSSGFEGVSNNHKIIPTDTLKTPTRFIKSGSLDMAHLSIGDVTRAFLISLTINGFSHEVLPILLHYLEDSLQKVIVP